MRDWDICHGQCGNCPHDGCCPMQYDDCAEARLEQKAEERLLWTDDHEEKPWSYK